MFSERIVGIILGAALLIGCLFPTSVHAETIYFVVGEWPGSPPTHNDAYILALENPDDIAHARDLIQYGPSIGSALAVAAIMVGPDGVNRNWVAPGKPLYSWHIIQFEGFWDATIEIWDGWPSGINGNPEAWIEMTRSYYDPPGVGHIGFWGYTVVDEVVPGPTADGDLDESGAVDMKDALIALRMASGMISPTLIQVLRGDVAPIGAPNGTIDISDALLILRKAFGQASY
jgi:hypothetical protein